jgi:hypothetical protein
MPKLATQTTAPRPNLVFGSGAVRAGAAAYEILRSRWVIFIVIGHQHFDVSRGVVTMRRPHSRLGLCPRTHTPALTRLVDFGDELRVTGRAQRDKMSGAWSASCSAAIAARAMRAAIPKPAHRCSGCALCLAISTFTAA